MSPPEHVNGPGPDAEAGAGIDAGPAFAGPGARARGARLTDAEPRLAGARVRLDGERVVWSREDAEAAPSAGTGIPSAVVDLVLGAGDEVGAGIGADADARADGGAVAFAGALAAAAGDPERERAIPVDQTHVSVIVDECWVVKIVGSWGAADRSAAILERLRAAGSTATPAFVGALEWQHPDRGSSALALVSAYVPDSDDGWTWAVDDALAHLARGAAKPDWPARLGALAAEMHTALRIEPTEAHAAPDPRAGDRARARAVHERAFAAIDAVGSAAAVAAPGSTAAGGLDGSARGSAGFAVRMRARREALAAAIGTIPDRSDAPLVTPHGDFHVGQILRTGDGRYLVLDFDGDPQWGPEQRFRPDGAARDVAHMLVSIDLVAAVVQRRLGGPDERAWSWADSAKQGFLEAYEAVAGSEMLDAAAVPGLVAEQLLIELAYAERFLPEWRYAPDGAITRRYASRRAANERSANDRAENDSTENDRTEDYDETEPPWIPPASPTT